jgi:2-C-methyl-D-erythritol 4-phosphate cytidylyltransferase
VTVDGILVAAGRGERFGGPKHAALLRGRPLWEWALDALRRGGVDRVVLVGDLPGGIAGGPRRRDSVRAGLEALPPDASHVLVHDAARPLASPDLVRRVIDRLLSGGVDAVVPVVPVRDTLKRVGDGWVVETVDRRGLAGAQTPQGFRVAALRAAHAANGDDDAGDDALLVERLLGSVATVEGEEANLKVTYPGDLALAEAWLP